MLHGRIGNVASRRVPNLLSIEYTVTVLIECADDVFALPLVTSVDSTITIVVIIAQEIAAHFVPRSFPNDGNSPFVAPRVILVVPITDVVMIDNVQMGPSKHGKQDRGKRRNDQQRRQRVLQ